METDSSSAVRPRILYVEREWEDEDAGRLARSLYSAFSSRYAFALDFGT